MHYPSDPHTLAIQNQFFYGPSLLINPVTKEHSTSVSFYLPNDTWFDFFTHRPVSGAGTTITYTDVTTSDIPILIRGGSIIPLRVKSAITTKVLREQDFELWVAPAVGGKAEGRLYMDDGESLVQEGVSEILFSWDGDTETVKMDGSFGFETSLRVKSVTVLGEEAKTYVLDEGLSGPWERRVGEGVMEDIGVR
jgi:alpha-glucosidase